MIRKLFAKLRGAQKVKSKKAAKKKAPAKPKAKTKGRKPASAKKKGPKKKKEPAGDQLGEVVAFFRIPVVAVIKVKQGSLKAGDHLWIKGHTTDLKQTIHSMQINHQPIQEARKGQEAGVKVISRVRRGDRVYRISP